MLIYINFVKVSFHITQNKIQKIYIIIFLIFFDCHIPNIVNKNIFVWLLIYFNITWFKIFYIDNIIKCVVLILVCVVFCVYNFNTYFQFILSIQICFSFISWNGSKCLGWILHFGLLNETHFLWLESSI